MHTISSPIVDFKVKAQEDDKPEEIQIQKIHEDLARPEFLQGTTYKLKTQLADFSLYITINDIILNPGTEFEKRQPFEVFINSKEMTNFQWIVGYTRLISAIFRKGGDIKFILEEMQSVFDPKGGYITKGRYIPSLVAEIGMVLEKHFKRIGLITDVAQAKEVAELIKSKKKEYLSKNPDDSVDDSGFPKDAFLCSKCNVKAIIKMEGCVTCLNCGDSKCG